HRAEHIASRVEELDRIVIIDRTPIEADGAVSGAAEQIGVSVHLAVYRNGEILGRVTGGCGMAARRGAGMEAVRTSERETGRKAAGFEINDDSAGSIYLQAY